MVRHHASLLGAAALACCFCGSLLAQAGIENPRAGVSLYAKNHTAMATTFSLHLYVHSQVEADTDADLVFEEVDRIEDLLSNYRPSSELSRINEDAFASRVTADPETFEFLKTCLFWSAQSDGAFDVTVGKLMKAWGFFKAKGRIPSDEELLQLRAAVGWQKVQLNSADRTVRFLSPGVELDPGGIGKGYAVERAIAILRTQHVQAALLSAGSSTIHALGAPPGEPGWKVRLPTLGEAPRTLSSIILRDTSLSTANCTEKNFTHQGHLYCHIMDPRTLRPVEGVVQVTVIAPSATDSDALSNVLFVLGAQKGSAVLRTHLQDSALVIASDAHSRVCNRIRWKGEIAAEYCTITVPKDN